MPTILYIFWLIFAPSPSVICALWVSTVPTAEQVQAACGTTELDQYQVEFQRLVDGSVACSGNATAIWAPDLECHLSARLDNYRMVIIRPAGAERVVCTVESPSPQPSPAQVSAACGDAPALALANGLARLELVETRTPATVADAVPACKPPKPQPGAGLLEWSDDITTAKDYQLLAARMIWAGYVRPVCAGGYSGLITPTAPSACGMDAARAAVREWQNRYDVEILSAADAWNVPPRLLKELIAHETQFWPWTGIHGETGLVQVTDDGLDLMLITYQPGHLSAPDRLGRVRAIQQRLACDGCSWYQSAEAVRADFDIYAQTLAAYYCNTGSWPAALLAWNQQWNIQHWEG